FSNPSFCYFYIVAKNSLYSIKLHIAAANGYEEVTLFLLKRGAKIDLMDRDGWQAIHIAACWCQLSLNENSMHQSLDFFSASIRRTSMREKKMISWKEAKQEAEMRGVATATNDKDAPKPFSPIPNGSMDHVFEKPSPSSESHGATSSKNAYGSIRSSHPSHSSKPPNSPVSSPVLTQHGITLEIIYVTSLYHIEWCGSFIGRSCDIKLLSAKKTDNADCANCGK
ncbi:unnamed protein product, partial [Trichobilharzia regenti]